MLILFFSPSALLQTFFVLFWASATCTKWLRYLKHSLYNTLAVDVMTF